MDRFPFGFKTWLSLSHLWMYTGLTVRRAHADADGAYADGVNGADAAGAGTRSASEGCTCCGCAASIRKGVFESSHVGRCAHEWAHTRARGAGTVYVRAHA